MPSQVTNYQCPDCMAPLHYDGSSGMLQCDYCGRSHTPESIEQYYQQHLQQAEQAAIDAVAAEAAAAAAGNDDVDYTSDDIWDAELRSEINEVLISVIIDSIYKINSRKTEVAPPVP